MYRLLRHRLSELRLIGAHVAVIHTNIVMFLGKALKTVQIHGMLNTTLIAVARRELLTAE